MRDVVADGLECYWTPVSGEFFVARVTLVIVVGLFLFAAVLVLIPSVSHTDESADHTPTTTRKIESQTAMPNMRAHQRPGLAAALNLHPLPIDIGHFYNKHTRRGILFSGTEAVFWGTGIATIVSSAQEFGDSFYSEMESSDRALLWGSVASFVATKAISTILCVSDARMIRDEHGIGWAPKVSIAPSTDQNSEWFLALSWSIGNGKAEH